MNTTGLKTGTVQVVRITYDDPATSEELPVTPENLLTGSEGQQNFYYNKSNGKSRDLSYLYDGYWYAGFKPNYTRGDMIKYEAYGTVNHSESQDVSSGTEANLTEDINVGDLNISVLTDIGDEVKAGKRIKADVAVENASTGETVNKTEGSVSLIFANDTWSETYSLDNFNGENDPDPYDSYDSYFYNSEVYLPSSTNSTYLMHVKASKNSGRNPHGTLSKVIKTLPKVQGEITGFSSQNCESSRMVEKCEPGAEVETEYTVTDSTADNVNLSVNLFNSSGRQELEVFRMDGSGDVYQQSFTLPEINTSNYRGKVEFEFNASSSGRYHVDRRNVTLDYFNVEHVGSPTTYAGGTYTLELFFQRPYSLKSLNKSSFERININITDPDSREVETLDMSELSYDRSDGVMKTDVSLNPELPTGVYNVKVNATNRYGVTSVFNSEFKVEDMESTFSLDSNTDYKADTLEAENFTLGINSRLSADNRLNITEDTPANISVVNESFTLLADAEDRIYIEVNLSKPADTSGEFKVEDIDTGYNRTVEVQVDSIDCQERSGRLCLVKGNTVEDGWINLSIDSQDPVLRNVELANLRPGNGKINYNVTFSGDIAEHVRVDGPATNRNLTEREELVFNYTAASRGVHTGSIEVKTEKGESIEIDTSLNASELPVQKDKTVNFSLGTQTLDLGEVPQGESRTETVEVENTGEKPITGFNVTSYSYSVSVSSPEIQPGETGDIELTFQSVETGSGQINIESGSATSTIAVTATPVENYGKKADKLENRLKTLQARVESGSSLEGQLTSVSTKISQIRTAWDGGNYERARSLYSTADATLTTVSSQLDSQSSKEPGGSDPGNTGGNTGQNQSSSGGSILPVIGGVLVIIMIGFIFFTSYVPDEGDPLYDVLGQ